MELKSTINDTWKLSMLGSLIGCLIILLFLDQTNQNASFSLVRSMTTSLGLAPLGGQLEPPSTINPNSITLNHTNSPSHSAFVNLMPSNDTVNVVEKPNITLDHTNNIPSQPALVNIMAPNDTINVVEKPNITLDHTDNIPSQPALVNQMPSNDTITVVEKPNITLDHTYNIPSQPALVDLMPSNNTLNVIGKPNITLDHTNNIPSQPELVNLMPSNYTINVIEKLNVTLDDHVETPYSNSSKINTTLGHQVERVDIKTEKECNIFEGKWVYKTEQVRLYDTNTCPFLEEKMSCQKNGRPDFEYEKWRWEPTNCDIPLFNGTYMLERLRNKRVIIVGDSLNRNMWESLACLLYTTIPSSRAYVQAASSTYKVFKAMDYNCVIEFHWSPFLIELNEHHRSGKKVLAVDQLSSSFKQWQGADVMVFNSGHWWTHMGKLRSWDMFQYEGKLMEEMPIELAYERGMKTWAKWVENNVDPKKTTVFFRSISPEHYREQWCYNITQPIMDESYESRYPKSLIDIIKGVIKGISKLHVKYLNITKLSSYRKDAHPSVYRRLDWKIYTTKYMTDIPSYADCSHWCLPGLPDTWNTLLYTSLFYNSSTNMSSL
ncbi:protein trichome birefringence-like 42 [Silene latifolia]|uniref:protein trichome birefringence-like 42 n=1 Tax=Silene latifolia TaxID=37657 RepID=UPI003D76B37D